MSVLVERRFSRAVIPFLVLIMAMMATFAAAQENDNPSGEPSLIFRAIVRDENQNQVVHAGETISVEIEIKNEGPGEAIGVEILINGTPELVEKLPGALPIGSLKPGDVRNLSVGGKAGTVKHSMPAELTLMLRSSSSLARAPLVKKFRVSLKPEDGVDEPNEAVNVDTIPTDVQKLEQPHAVGIAVGIGRFREGTMARVKYASQDAEVVAKYWSSLGGIPEKRIRQLVDGHAFKSDLAETFEVWLPRQIDAASVVYVFMSGRAIVDADSGEVSLIPFDATGTNGKRLYSLKRLRDILNRLPIYRAIVMLDLSIEPSPSSMEKKPAALFWDGESSGGAKIMWMVGNRAAQEAHEYEPGRHGLFTYQLLQGLGGAADLDKSGTVMAGELCTYVKGRVAIMAKEVFGNEQEPFCTPDLGHEALIRGQAMARFQ